LKSWCPAKPAQAATDLQNQFLIIAVPAREPEAAVAAIPAAPQVAVAVAVAAVVVAAAHVTTARESWRPAAHSGFGLPRVVLPAAARLHRPQVVRPRRARLVGPSDQALRSAMNWLLQD